MLLEEGMLTGSFMEPHAPDLTRRMLNELPKPPLTATKY